MIAQQTIRVVVADDHAVVRAGILSIIDAEPDMRVVGEAHNGQQGAEVARATRADVLVMDISMPDSDGLAGLRAVKEIRPETQVLMLTTFNVTESIEQALRLGASGYILKTASADEVIASIRSAHRGERVFSQPIQDRFIDYFLERTTPTPAPPSELSLLTERELDVFKQLARGHSNAEIAEALYLSEATVKTYITRLLAKLGLRDRVQAVIFALQFGLVPSQDAE